MTKRELAEIYLYELYNVAEHVDRCAQCARSDIEHSPEQALKSLRVARTSASLLEMHFDDAIRALEALVAGESQGTPKDTGVQ